MALSRIRRETTRARQNPATMEPTIEGERTRSDKASSALWTRRRLLVAAGGALAAAAGVEAARLGSSSAPGRSLPASLHSRPDLSPPITTVLVAARGAATGHVFVAGGAKGAQQGPLIVDDSGQPVWFHPVTGQSATNVDVQRYRGKPVLTWWQGKVTGGHGLGEYVLMDTSYREVKRVGGGHGLQGDLHEFLITPTGTALFTVYHPVPADLLAVGGPGQGVLLDSIVQEVDIATGRVLFEWRARDHVLLTESYATYSGNPFDFFHVNSVDVDADGNLLISGRHTWTVYKLDRRTGKVIWRLGGKQGDFELGSGVRFAWQHDVRRQRDGSITVFDNGDGPHKVERRSRGLRLLVDERTRRARLAQAYTHNGYLTEAMGSMQPLPDGGAFVGWGTVPAFSEFTAAGALRFDARLAGPSYRAVRRQWTAQPAAPPDVVVAAARGRRSAYVSWNGATAVSRWRLDDGHTRDDLQPVKVVPRRGFETVIPLRTAARYLAVEALDARGRSLGRSRIVRI
jgi:Arylsulfotransferase (ASST)